MIRFSILVAVALILSQLGCTSGQLSDNSGGKNSSMADVQVNHSKTRDPELERNRNLWGESGLQNYDMVIEHYGGNGLEIAESVKIEVRSGNSVSIDLTRKTDPRSITPFKEIDTVEKMFDYIQNLRDKAAASVNSNNKADVGFPKLNVKYHGKLGYPTRISVLTSLAMDADTTFEVKELEPVKIQ